MLTNLPPEQRGSYEALTTALDTRFGLSHQTELNRMRLKARTRRDASLAELAAEDVEHLVRLAYPEAAEAMVEVLAKDQFVDALPDEDMRLRIRQNKPATSLGGGGDYWNNQHTCLKAFWLQAHWLIFRERRCRNQQQVIHKGTELAHCETIHSVLASRVDIEKGMLTGCTQNAKILMQLPPHLKELYERSVTD